MRKLIISLFLIILLLCIGGTVGLTLYLSYKDHIADHQFPLNQKWVFEADRQIGSAPVVYKNFVLFRTYDRLYVVNAETGEMEWSYFLSKDNYTDPPLVQDNSVILTHLKGTTALDLSTGEVLWDVFDDNTRVDTVPVVSNQDIVVIVDKDILIRDLDTGELLWKVQNPYGRSNAVVGLDNDTLYVVFRDEMHSYNIQTGERLWHKPTEEWSLGPGISGLFTGGVWFLELKEGGLAAYSVDDKKILWRREDLSLKHYPITQNEDTLFISTRGSVPVALEATTGKTKWEANDLSDYDDYQTPLIFDNKVYIRGLFKKKIYSLDINNGNLFGQISLGIPDLISNNASYSLGPVQYNGLIIFPAGNKLLAYGNY
ncbi:MAG: PQQ-binding-like beta-propeller repeat protein [Deltaproteobacteria bacterium]|nr:PQQ-binding-like beta-propeller repeat protein [Deltaproteobacteria bacterium]